MESETGCACVFSLRFLARAFLLFFFNFELFPLFFFNFELFPLFFFNFELFPLFFFNFELFPLFSPFLLLLWSEDVAADRVILSEGTSMNTCSLPGRWTGKKRRQSASGSAREATLALCSWWGREGYEGSANTASDSCIDIYRVSDIYCRQQQCKREIPYFRSFAKLRKYINLFKSIISSRIEISLNSRICTSSESSWLSAS